MTDEGTCRRLRSMRSETRCLNEESDRLVAETEAIHAETKNIKAMTALFARAQRDRTVRTEEWDEPVKDYSEVIMMGVYEMFPKETCPGAISKFGGACEVARWEKGKGE